MKDNQHSLELHIILTNFLKRCDQLYGIIFHDQQMSPQISQLPFSNSRLKKVDFLQQPITTHQTISINPFKKRDSKTTKAGGKKQKPKLIKNEKD